MSEANKAAEKYVADRVRVLSMEQESYWRRVHLDECVDAFDEGYAAGLASRTPLVWSREPPKVAGLYMRKRDDFRSAQEERVLPNQLEINWTPSLWYGPIPEPEQSK